MSSNYLSFFNLNDDPFRLTPDIAYFYNSQVHATALLSLEYCVKQKEGFCVLTGEPGTGKTTILRLFIEKWKDQAEIALIMTPRLMPDEFFQAILDDFKITRTTTNKNDMLKAFRDFLLTHAANDRRVVIIVDEAQELPETTLEELRLLSNLETEKEKLLQIMLVGQHELSNKLRSKPLRQLNQRITVRVQLKPLTAPETSDYVNTRLIKGGNSSLLYNQKAKDLIYEYSGGIPRTINLLASRGLMSAFLDGSKEVLEKHVEQGATDVLDTNVPAPAATNRRLKKMVAGGPSNGFTSSFSLRRVALVLLSVTLLAATGTALFVLRDKWDTIAGTVNKRLSAFSSRSIQLPVSSARFAAPSSAKAGFKPVSSGQARMSNVSSAKVASAPVKVAPVKTVHEIVSANPTQAAIASLNAILEMWKYQPVSSGNTQKKALVQHLDDLAESRGLRLLHFAGSIDYLVQCNYPSLVLIGVAADGMETYTAVTKVSNAMFSVTPAVNGKSLLTRPELEAIWHGRALIVWKNFVKIPPKITRGTRSKSLKTVQELLENAGIPTATSTVFDQKTEDSLKQYQSLKGLKVTGQPDSLTLLQLYNESKYGLHPTLK